VTETSNDKSQWAVKEQTEVEETEGQVTRCIQDMMEITIHQIGMICIEENTDKSMRTIRME